MSKNHEKYLEFVNQVFDTARKELNISSDAELASVLYDNKGNLSKYRTGERIMNDWKLLKACRVAKIEMIDALNMIILHKSLRAEVKDIMLDMMESLKKEKP